MLRHNAVGFGSLGQKALRKFFQRVRKLVAPRLLLGPDADLFDPLPLVPTVELASVDA